VEVDVSIAASPDVEVTIAAFNKSKIRVTGHCRKVTIKHVSTTAEIDCTELSCSLIQVINASQGCTVNFPPMLLVRPKWKSQGSNREEEDSHSLCKIKRASD